jgi:hypothetical protein
MRRKSEGLIRLEFAKQSLARLFSPHIMRKIFAKPARLRDLLTDSQVGAGMKISFVTTGATDEPRQDFENWSLEG